MRELTASPEFTQSCLTNLTARQACQAVRFLAQAAVNYKEASTLLSKALPDITNHITDLQSPVEALTEMVSVLPTPSTTLAPTAIALTQQILENLPAETKPAARAYWLVHLAHRLSETGHPEDAVAATQEAAILLGEPADANPDRYRPDLAATLETLAIQLSELGHPEEALPPAKEAAAIYQELAAAQPGLYRPSLARALVTLSFRYYDRSSTAHTLSAAENAVTVYRELASQARTSTAPGPPAH